MKQFTVITKTKVYRYPAKSVQALTRQLREDGLEWQAIHEDKEHKKS